MVFLDVQIDEIGVNYFLFETHKNNVYWNGVRTALRVWASPDAFMFPSIGITGISRKTSSKKQVFFISSS